MYRLLFILVLVFFVSSFMVVSNSSSIIFIIFLLESSFMFQSLYVIIMSALFSCASFVNSIMSFRYTSCLSSGKFAFIP